MSLRFGAVLSDRVNCGSDPSIDNFAAHSLLLWVYPLSLPGVRMLASKETNTTTAEKEWSLRNTGQLSFNVNTSGVDAFARSDNSAGNILTTNKWWLVVFVLDSGLVPRIYLGDLTTPPYEVAYITQTTGTGTVDTDGNGPFLIGNNAGLNLAPDARIARVTYLNRALTLAEINGLWHRFTYQLADQKALWILGVNGAGTQPDWTGNGNNGTVTGATVADGVPLGPFADFYGWPGAFLAAAGGVTALPGVNTATISQQSPTAQGSALAALSEVGVTISAQVSSVAGAAIASPTVATGDVSQLTPSILGSALAVPPELGATIAAQGTSVAGAAIASPLDSTTTISAPIVVVDTGTGVTAFPAVVTITANPQAVAVSVGATASPLAVAATFSQPQPTLQVGAVVSAAAQDTTVTAQLITAGGAALAAPPNLGVVAALSSPSLMVGSTFLADPMTGALSAPPTTVVTGALVVTVGNTIVVEPVRKMVVEPVRSIFIV